jgi:hypothetical protein
MLQTADSLDLRWSKKCKNSAGVPVGPRYRGKPPGMSDRTFHKLNDQLTKEDIRYMCALLGKADPEFCDEEPPAPPKHPAAPASELGSGSVGLLLRKIRQPQDESQVQKEDWIGDFDTQKKAAILGGPLSLKLTRTNYTRRKFLLASRIEIQAPPLARNEHQGDAAHLQDPIPIRPKIR